jgi:hypothetical protein
MEIGEGVILSGKGNIEHPTTNIEGGSNGGRIWRFGPIEWLAKD